MANNHGGPRTPSAPAPVSGPGQLARRTDGGPAQTTIPMTGMAYGENADYNDIQSSAPLAATPSVSNMRARNQRPTGPSVAATPLFSPTQRPDEPVTAGAPFGPGDGPMAPTPMAAPQATLTASLQKLAAYSNNPQLSYLLSMAERHNW
jgi:hypothetical protein